MDTPAHRLDAQAKAIVTLVFIGTVASFPNHAVSALTPFLIYPVALVSLGRIPAWDIIKRMLVAAPFALIVGIFNPIFDREPVAVIGPFIITGGWVSFASIMLRFVLTVGAALALVACTGMHRLAAALEQLGCPRVFAVQLLFLYRYLFVVADEGARMMRGVELRSAGAGLMRFRVYGSLIGHLLLRSMDRAERIHRAMVARGFDGEIRVMNHSSFQWRDWIFTCISIAFFAVGRALNLADQFGQLIIGSAQ